VKEKILQIALVTSWFVGITPQVQAAGFDDCKQFFPAAPPQVQSPGRQRQLCFDAFAVLYSGESKTPVYVVEQLTAEQLTQAQNEVRTNRFYPEARVPFADRAQLDDYRGSGFDRGHMAPAADMPNAQAMAQSFSLANMSPQDRINNRETWANIEKATRAYAKRAPAKVYVFTGPLFKQPVATIGANNVWVPAQFFKVVYTPSTQRAWGYLIDNTPQPQNLKPLPYAEWSAKTGLNLLGEAPVGRSGF
jgi:endonuclease G